ncbi:helix-turn-helix transcriptional regulator [Kribbella solani]|uniref:helix-turn-helix transcriptional regulator n=1 Tax=Kribbella solani TaxID=236067 RepID=UPI0029A874BA|nr:helix-turn-helix transcriptional regulator [Kribbella solani]MDX2973401.1 helix-turn-helix transcriptional regulator [Kribbella solani]
MREQQVSELGQMIRKARTERELSTRSLADMIGVDKATIIRIESGEFRSPKPNILQNLASALDLPLSDLYALAHYTEPTTLPTLAPYLRAKYTRIPPHEVAELEHTLHQILKRHGYDGNGPAPGEDET